MVRAIGVALLLVAAMHANAQQFRMAAWDASDGTVPGGVAGTGMDLDGGMFYHDPIETLGSTGEPTYAALSIYPTLEFDTYLTVDSGPVEPAPGYDGTDIAPATEWSESPGFTETDYRGVVNIPLIPGWPLAFPVSEPGMVGTVYEFFLGRLTHTGTLTGTLVAHIIEEGPSRGSFEIIMGEIVTLEQAFQGKGKITTDLDGNQLDNDHLGYFYAFVRKDAAVEIDGITYTVSDLYLQTIFDTTVCPNINGDARVDLDDLQILLFNFGGTFVEGDVNHDDVVDLDDLQLVLFHFGESCGP